MNDIDEIDPVLEGPVIGETLAIESQAMTYATQARVFALSTKETFYFQRLSLSSGFLLMRGELQVPDSTVYLWT